MAITPARPRDGDDLRCEVVVPSEDPDGDPVSYQYTWTIGGVEVGADAALSAAQTAEDDAVLCTVTPVARGLEGLPGSDSTTVHPDCMVHLDEDFSSGWGAFSDRAGDADLSGGAARLFRTSSEWGMASATLSRDEPGALDVSARMVLRAGTASFPDESGGAVHDG